MPRTRRDCPTCGKRNLAKLSNHLADIHQLSGKERQYYLSKARSLGDQRESEEMSSRKRIRNESDDEMSTASPGDERESEEEMSSPKRMRNEPDHDMSTVSNEDISVHQSKKTATVPKPDERL